MILVVSSRLLHSRLLRCLGVQDREIRVNCQLSPPSKPGIPNVGLKKLENSFILHNLRFICCHGVTFHVPQAGNGLRTTVLILQIFVERRHKLKEWLDIIDSITRWARNRAAKTPRSDTVLFVGRYRAPNDCLLTLGSWVFITPKGDSCLREKPTSSLSTW